jgi:hypothetical protein
MSLQPKATDASTPGTIAAPLLSCPNVNASSDDKVTIGDVLQVIGGFFVDYPDPDYVFLNDLSGAGDNPDGLGRISDVIAAVSDFGVICPHVDTQVAEATLWILNDHPELLTENVAALAAAGYEQGSSPVPGQGVHYVNFANWDGMFEPAAPEGLVYTGGKLAAQLYVIDGTTVGWIEDPGPDEGSCWDAIDNGGDGDSDAADGDCGAEEPAGDVNSLDDTDIDPLCNPSLKYPNGCSWDGSEGWHLHYRLCTTHIGTPNAFAIPIGNQPGDGEHDYCKSVQMQSPGGYMRYADRVGWMGHLWNWLGNANQIPDVDGTMNGRFADCFPDGFWGWKAYNCPQ